jgi:anthranilate phosphoribosyltransferase
MTAIKDMTARVQAGESLSTAEASEAAEALAAPDLAAEDKLTFLEALHDRGETAAEVAGFACYFRSVARDSGVGDAARGAIDIVGTGGDHSGSFNISTAASLVVAACGVPVCKHGNRSITSKTGSADLLEAIGIDLAASDEARARSLRDHRFCFFFAPAFHPAFKEIMPVRKRMAAEGKRSVFNLLGPLINPARPPYQLLGVFSPDWLTRLAEALGELGVRRGLVVHCQTGEGKGLDELSCAGENLAVGFGELKATPIDLRPESLGLTPCAVEVLRGGEAEENLSLLLDFAEGRGRPGLVDTILLNAGVSLWIAEAEATPRAGVDRARSVVESGDLARWLRSLRTGEAR